MRIQLKSASIHYVDQGHGPAVLLLHAFPLDHTMWESQLARLSLNFRVIAPDIRGFGESQPPSPWTMEEMADEINEFLDALRIDTCSVAGVSMGGYIALAFWSRYSGRIRKLVLSNTRARADNETEQRARTEMIAAIEQSGAGILPDRMLPRLLQPNPSADAARLVRGMINRANAAAAIYAVMAMRDRPDSSSLLHRINCPTMVIAGENDAIIRADDSRAMAEAIPGARFERVPDSGHLSSLENPDEFNRVMLEFLNE